MYGEDTETPILPAGDNVVSSTTSEDAADGPPKNPKRGCPCSSTQLPRADILPGICVAVTRIFMACASIIVNWGTAPHRHMAVVFKVIVDFQVIISTNSINQNCENHRH